MLAVLAELGPRRRFRHPGQHANRAPIEFRPLVRALAALDHNANWNAYKRSTQLTASRCRIGKPAARFCGFMRMVLSAVIASIR